MKLLFFTNIPSPYFVAFLNEIGKLAEVIAVFEMKSFAHRDDSWKTFEAQNFKPFFLNGINISKTNVFDLKATKFIKDNPDAVVIIANPLTPTGMQCIEYCRIHKRPYILQSEGGIPKEGKGIKELLKRHFIKGATLYLSGMKADGDYFAAYGADISKIRTYPFASLHKRDLISSPATTAEKEQLKKDLGIKCKRMILFVGRVIHIKGIDVLIKACQGLPDDVGIYIVGGNPTDSYKKLADSLNIKNITYIPFVILDNLKKYYLAADIFVLPTRKDTWGLVINEAMSFGLPIITTRNCVAGVQLVQDGENGYLIENEDYKGLHDCILSLLNDKCLSNKMGLNNIKKMEQYTFENMAKVVFNFILTDFINVI